MTLTRQPTTAQHMLMMRRQGLPGHVVMCTTTTDHADTLAREAEQLEAKGSTAEADKKRQEAVGSYAMAEQMCQVLAAKSPTEEEAVYQAGACCYRAMCLLDRKDAAAKDLARARDLAGRARKHYDAYATLVLAGAPQGTSSDPGKAQKQAEAIAGHRQDNLAAARCCLPRIHLVMGEIDEARKSAETLVADDTLGEARRREARALLDRIEAQQQEQEQKP